MNNSQMEKSARGKEWEKPMMSPQKFQNKLVLFITWARCLLES